MGYEIVTRNEANAINGVVVGLGLWAFTTLDIRAMFGWVGQSILVGIGAVMIAVVCWWLVKLLKEALLRLWVAL